MARDSSGTHTLPAGNPVVSGTAISSSVTNATLSDISAALTDSLSRTGDGSMSVPLELTDGIAATPSLSFDSDTDTGLFRKGANNIGVAVGGVEVGDISSTGLTMTLLTGLVFDPGGRLTLTTAVPVTTSDVTGATTVYYTPYKHNKIQLYNGTAWQTYTANEMSQATTDATKSPAAVANASVYDVFVWSDSGTMRATRGPAWTSDTVRGTGAGTTELERLEGRWVNKIAITNGPAAQRGLYVGTIRSNLAAQINDSLAKRHVWNAYNRVTRNMRVSDAATSWTYTTAVLRQANANADNLLDYVCGLSEEPVHAVVTANVSASTTAGNHVHVGVDSTTVGSAQILSTPETPGANVFVVLQATYEGFPGIGRHALNRLEYGSGSGTTTWRESGLSPDSRLSGISGRLMA